MAELDLDLDLLNSLETERLLLNSPYSGKEPNLTSEQLELILKHPPPNPNAQQAQINYSSTQPNHHKDVLPNRVGKYALKKKIGSGNFAVVKLGEHIPTNAKVAVKIIDKRKTSKDNMKKIWREIEIMKKIDHKNIIKLYQVLQTDDYLFLITDYCEGGELFDYLIQHGRLKENQARLLFKQIIDAIEYLHDNNIVHRDLKAENLLLSEDKKTIKVADFGFSNYYNPGDLLNTFCGSLPYASPELFQGKEYNGCKADVWSLGVVLYALVCGALPFGKEKLQELRNSILNGLYRVPFWLSEDCEDLIKNMLNVEIEKRYTVQQVKAHKWMKQLKEELNDSEINQTIGNLNRLNINVNESLNDELLREECSQLASKFNLTCVDDLVSSVRERKFDDYYALFHLSKDFGINMESPSSQTLPSSPLLPVIAAGQHRKSSITTGIVERENSSNSDEPIYDQSSHQQNANLLNAQATTHRRHTFGPESSSTTDTTLTNPPAVYLTPANCLPNILLNSCDTNANQAAYPSTLNSNFPLKMDLLKPPQVFLFANNNMLRRASDGQANYYNQEHFHSLNQVDSDCENYSLNGSNSEIDNQQRMTPNQNSVYELSNNGQPYGRYPLNEQQSTNPPTPGSPLQFQTTNQSPFYPQQQQQQLSNNCIFQSPSSPIAYLRSANSPYTTERINYNLRKKRNSLTEASELGTRRKMHGNSAAVASGNNLNNSNNFNTSSGFNLLPSNHSTQLPYSVALNRRRASEGSGQLLQQLTPAFRPFANETPFSAAPRNFFSHLIANQLDSANFHSNSSINQSQYKNQLCVSSPPSLTTSPIHQTTQLNHLAQSQPQAYQKSQSPPCQSLQMISEEQPTNLCSVFGSSKMTGDFENALAYENNSELIDQQTNDPQLYPQHGNNAGSLPCSPITYPPFTAITPPQSFRSSTDDCLMSDEQQLILSKHLQQKLNQIQGYDQTPVYRPQASSGPSIHITNEFGCEMSPNILPVPKRFQQYQEMKYPDQAVLYKMQHDLLEMNDDNMNTASLHNLLYKQDHHKLAQEASFDGAHHYNNWYNRKKIGQDRQVIIGTLIQKKSAENVLQQVHINRNSEEDDQFEHLDQEFDEADEEVQDLLYKEENLRLNESLFHSDSGSILIDDVKLDAAKKLLLKMHEIQVQNDPLLNQQLIGGGDIAEQRILFEENNICIEAQYNELKQRLVLRRVSGEMESYTALCQQLINNMAI